MSAVMHFSEAVEIFHQHAADTGYLPDQPCALSSELINGTWYLRNTRGLIARVGTKKRAVL